MTSDTSSHSIHVYRAQSWQIEMLIAGGTVITLASLSDEIKHFFFKAYPLVEFSHYRILLLFGIFLVTRILLFGFVTNLMLRAVWLAYLGINFSFPDGVNYGRIKSVEAIDKIASHEGIHQRVTRLERLCNLSYSLAILLAIFAASTFISLAIISWPFSLMGLGYIVEEPAFSYSMSFLIILVQIGLLDRLLFSKRLIGKTNIITRLRDQLYTFLSIITLSFLFRRELLVIKTNINRYLYGFLIIFTFGLASVVTAIQIGEFYPYGTLNWDLMDDRDYYAPPLSPRIKHYHYDSNLTDNSVTFSASIQSDIVSDDYLRLFAVSWSMFDDYLKYAHEKHDYPLTKRSSWTKEQRKYVSANADSLYQKIMNDIFIIKIDDEVRPELDWKRARHPITREEGYLTYIDISDIELSPHTVSIDVRYFDNKDSIVVGEWDRIPFWKE